MDVITLVLLFVILVQLAGLNGEIKGDATGEEVSEYLKGRRWACREYYLFARSLTELDTRFVGVFDPTEFQQGAMAALKELHERHDEI